MQSSVIAWAWDWTKSIGIALVAWLFLRTFVVAAFYIPSGSMEPALLVRDWIFVNKALYGAEVPLIHRRLPSVREPRRGDIVVVDSKEAPIELVKRLIGIPGDTLAMVGGRLVRNGRIVNEPYAMHTDIEKSERPEMRSKMHDWQVRHLSGRDTAGYRPDLQDWGPIVVARDSLFMMGDNREDSYDSRYYGFLARSSVRGSPMFIYYSYDASSYRPLPFVTAVRWRRIFSSPE
ncbi:MAG: signal peptidase I [Gemmatimonadales bacterium]|nr:signal peptidase I [Gemmatimonadales bacterium]